MQRVMPRLIDAHFGSGEPQSQQTALPGIFNISSQSLQQIQQSYTKKNQQEFPISFLQ